MELENHNIDVINVAGLLMTGEDDGLERAVREHIKPRSVVTIAPTPPSAIQENPDASIARAIDMMSARIQEIESSCRESRIMLVGRSYGAFIALLAACRMRFERLFKIILIEGPLHPEVEVEPPVLLPPLVLCTSHYRDRTKLAQEAVDVLEEFGASKVVIVQGGREDSVVPLEAQVLPGDFRGNGTGTLVRLVPSLGGKNEGLKRVLPDSYRTHLFWSDEKMEAILSIISRSAA